MLRTILVPLDGSALAEQAIPHAVRLARRTGADLVLMRAAPFAHTAGRPRSPLRVTVRDAEDYLRALAYRLERDGLTVKVEVLHADPVRAITFAARARGADMIVMSTHGRSGLRRALLGSVAEAIVATVTVPVLLVRTSEDGVAAEDPYRRILVPLDGSKAAEEALVTLRDLQIGDDTEITILRATPQLVAGHLETGEEAVLLEQQHAEARTYLAEVAERHAFGQPYRLETPIAQPAVAIVDTAMMVGSDLIAMVTHGRTGFSRVVHGSIASQVLGHTRVPVLLLHLQEPAVSVAATTAAEEHAYV